MSVGMSLVFNAASRLKEIASVYADPSELQNRPKLVASVARKRGGLLSSASRKAKERIAALLAAQRS